MTDQWPVPRRFCPDGGFPPWERLVEPLPRHGAPGFTHIFLGAGIERLEFRNDAGLLVGVFGSRRGSIALMVDPKWRRRGIGLSLLREAQRLNIPMTLRAHRATRAGWLMVEKFLRERDNAG
jgi:GNAT superfamily N-acetyltransferase